MSQLRAEVRAGGRFEHEGADHFVTAGLSVTQALIASLAAEKRNRQAPQSSAGFMAARQRGARLNSGNPFPRSYSAERF